ncbi:MAG: sigma-70 family RNA polymerase sigma factor [Myxococcota bacterium]
MTRLSQGDRSAFPPVFEALWPRLQRFTERMLPHRADAEDAAQAALLRIFNRAHEFDPSRPALPWALGIAAWECRTLRKKTQRRRETDDEATLDLASEGHSPEELTIRNNLTEAAARVLGELRPADVEALLTMAHGERGEHGGLPAATFRKRLERALQRLRTAWRTNHGAP